MAKHHVKADIFTGTAGTLSLEDDHGKLHNMYLYWNRGIGKLPVPRIFYKIFIPNGNISRAIVYAGVNNPFITSKRELNNYIYCKDQIRDHNVPWDNSNWSKGYMYACKLQDFQAHFPDKKHFPDLSLKN